MANISIRKHIRWIPAPASEPTSTVVLTSPGRRFVDVRILQGPGSEKGQLDWAFAGTSSSQPAQEPGFRRAVWKHWVDSSTADAETVRDEAEVRDAGDAVGTELEAGRMVNPATGEEADYEEAWVSVEPVATESEGEAACAVLRTFNDEDRVRGMVVRVGHICQGILRVGDAVTVERWEWNRESGWTLLARFGDGKLPVQALIGYARFLTVDGLVENGGRTWRVVETRASAAAQDAI